MSELRPPPVRPYVVHPAITVVRCHLPLRQRIVDALWTLLVLVAGH